MHALFQKKLMIFNTLSNQQRLLLLSLTAISELRTTKMIYRSIDKSFLNIAMSSTQLNY